MLDEDKDQPESKVSATKPRKERSKKKLYLGIVGLLAIVVAIGSIIYFQHTKIRAAAVENQKITSEKSKLDNELKEAEKLKRDAVNAAKVQSQKIDELEKKVSSLQTPAQATFEVAVLQAKHNGKNYQTKTMDLFLVEITAANTSDINGYFSITDLKLKDKDNRTHPICSASAIGYYVCKNGGSGDVPAGGNELLSQQLKGGEEVRGYISFYTPVNINDFTLVYGDQNIPVKGQ